MWNGRLAIRINSPIVQKGAEVGTNNLKNNVAKSSKWKRACGCWGAAPRFHPLISMSPETALTVGSCLAREKHTPSSGATYSQEGVWDQMSLLHLRTTWRNIPAPELRHLTTTLFNFSLDPILLPSVPYRCCSKQHSPGSGLQVNIQIYFLEKASQDNKYPRMKSTKLHLIYRFIAAIAKIWKQSKSMGKWINALFI